MSGVQSKGPVINLKEYNADDLKRIITAQQREILVKNERLKGVEDLTRICSELEEKRQSWQIRADNYETALKRAEARVAYLNKKLGIGPQTTLDMDVINPGVSRKDFDAITKENIRLKEALEHIVPIELGGKDIVINTTSLPTRGFGQPFGTSASRGFFEVPIQESGSSFETSDGFTEKQARLKEMENKTGPDELRTHSAERKVVVTMTGCQNCTVSIAT